MNSQIINILKHEEETKLKFNRKGNKKLSVQNYTLKLTNDLNMTVLDVYLISHDKCESRTRLIYLIQGYSQSIRL